MSNKDGNPNTYLMLLGVTESENDVKFDHASSWLHPAACKSLDNNVKYQGFKQAEKAYQFHVSNNSNFTIELNPEKAPIINPVFKFEGLDALPGGIKLGKKRVADDDFKTGRIIDGSVIVYLKTKFTRKTRITFTL
jgi:hypothetical protein